MSYEPVPVAARSKACSVFNRLNTGIRGSNPARCMDVEALRRADPPSKEFYQMSKNRLISFRSQVLIRKRPDGVIRIYFNLLYVSYEYVNVDGWWSCLSLYLTPNAFTT
jgi:hypothetical protein